ncbi:hypothetical protein [Sphingobium aquiterrae]|uniref:hypothetical protein n=1 Tax=Sphingobium aquiterrae TaxID=2038656 RepID=UPI0030192521
MRNLPSLPPARSVWPIAATLAVLAASASAAVDKGSAAGKRISVSCAAGRGFAIQLDDRQAIAFVDGRPVRLTRRPSSLGMQYRSGDAALIIDGDFVAFVLKDDLAYEDCRLVPRQ